MPNFKPCDGPNGDGFVERGMDENEIEDFLEASADN